MPKYPGRVIQWGSKGEAVKHVQFIVGVRRDGDFGARTDAAVRQWQRHHGLLPDGDVGPQTWAKMFGGTVVKEHDRKPTPLNVRAFRIALGEVGVMESDGNNRGVPLVRYIRPNGGVGPESWCGDFAAYCYRRAGSKAVDRQWALVAWMHLGGARVISKSHAASVEKGYIVRFNFPGGTAYDHTGMFDRWLGGGWFLCVEGNTGPTGAVSDSTTGEDGVYHKKRHISQVNDFVRITR